MNKVNLSGGGDEIINCVCLLFVFDLGSQLE